MGTWQCFSQEPQWNPSRVITGLTNPLEDDLGYGLGLPLHDSTKDSILFINCVFNGGPTIYGVSHVYFYNCKFLDEEVKLGGVTTNNITFDRCLFDNSTSNSIVTNIGAGFDHYNLVIKNCHFSRWGRHGSNPICKPKCEGCDRTVDYTKDHSFDGVTCLVNDTVTNVVNTSTGECTISQVNCERCSDGYNKFDHALYMRATDALIENNTFYHTIGGPAISVRNSATIRGNKVYSDHLGVGGALGYWTQYKARGSETLTIENNIFVELAQHTETISADTLQECDNAFKSLMSITRVTPEKAVQHVNIGFNTFVVLDGNDNQDFSMIGINSGYDEGQINVYGNLFVDLRNDTYFVNETTGKFVDTDYNLFTSDLYNFNECAIDQIPYDFHLTNGGDAWNYFNNTTSFDLPDEDKDGNVFPVSDARVSVGAYQYKGYEKTYYSSDLDGSNLVLQESNAVSISSALINNANLELSSDNAVFLEPGFSIERGSILSISMNEYDCDYYDSNANRLDFDREMNIEGIKNEEHFNIYPNPTSSFLNLPHGWTRIIAYNSTGKRVFDYTNNSDTTKIDVSDMPSGVYIVTLIKSSRKETIKIIKK